MSERESAVQVVVRMRQIDLLQDRLTLRQQRQRSENQNQQKPSASLDRQEFLRLDWTAEIISNLVRVGDEKADLGVCRLSSEFLSSPQADPDLHRMCTAKSALPLA